MDYCPDLYDSWASHYREVCGDIIPASEFAQELQKFLRQAVAAVETSPVVKDAHRLKLRMHLTDIMATTKYNEEYQKVAHLSQLNLSQWLGEMMISETIIPFAQVGEFDLGQDLLADMDQILPGVEPSLGSQALRTCDGSDDSAPRAL